MARVQRTNQTELLCGEPFSLGFHLDSKESDTEPVCMESEVVLYTTLEMPSTSLQPILDNPAEEVSSRHFAVEAELLEEEIQVAAVGTEVVVVASRKEPTETLKRKVVSPTETESCRKSAAVELRLEVGN